MKNVLFIHHESGIGGSPINMINIIEYLDKSKFKAKVLLLKNSSLSKLLEEKNINYEIVNYWFYRRFYKYFYHIVPSYIKWYQLLDFIKCTLSWILSRYYFANKILENQKCDIIHLNSSVLTDWLAPSKCKAKVVIHIQEPFSTGYFGLRSCFFRKQIKLYADKIIVISRDNSNRLNVPSKSVIVYNFVHDNFFSSAPNNSTRNKIIYVGGQSKIKGFHTVINALEFLNKDIIVLFLGYYNDSSKYLGIKGFLRRIVDHHYKDLKKMRTSRNCIEVGFKNEVFYYIQNSHILISPFTKDHFSRPVIEAFAASRPAIGSNIVGMEEIIDHNTNGIIVEKNNSKALANAINYLCSNSEIAQEMGLKGYNIAKKLYSYDNIKKIEKVYFEICEDI